MLLIVQELDRFSPGVAGSVAAALQQILHRVGGAVSLIEWAEAIQRIKTGGGRQSAPL